MTTYKNSRSLLPDDELGTLHAANFGPLDELEGSSAAIEELTQGVLGDLVEHGDDCVLNLDIETFLISDQIPIA